MKKVISILLVIAVLSCFMVTVVSAANSAATADIMVSDAQITKGQNATVSVSIANVPSYRSYAMAVKYDADKLEVVSVNGSGYLTINTDNKGVIYVSFANTVNLNAGELFSVTFKTKLNCGESSKVSVDVEELWAADQNGKGQKLSFNDNDTGSVSIAHKPETVKGYAATCTQSGLTDGSKCSICGEILKAQVKIDALGHQYKAVVTAPTCTEGGYTTYTCSVCGDSYVGDKTAAKGHTEATIAAVAPTCIETGLTEGKYCSVCNVTLVAQKIVPALGHTEVDVAGKAATCTEDGLTAGKKCSVCGVVTVAQEVIKATGHNFASEYQYDDEQHWHVCVNCGALSTKEDHVHNIQVDDKLYCECGHSIPAPTEPTQPDVTDPSTPAPDDDDEPETGDITGLIVFGVVAVVAMAGAVAYTVKRKFAK